MSSLFYIHAFHLLNLITNYLSLWVTSSANPRNIRLEVTSVLVSSAFAAASSVKILLDVLSSSDDDANSGWVNEWDILLSDETFSLK